MSIAEQLAECQNRIAQACEQASRSITSVLLIAVSKTHPAQSVEAAFNAGQRHFGENYVQECIEKIQVLNPHRAEIIWHFIGPLQSNKTKLIAEQVDWVQSIDRLKIAERLSSQRPTNLVPLKVLVQVNISGETTKSGVQPNETLRLCQEILDLPNLQLRGLMAIPEPGVGSTSLKELHTLFETIQSKLGLYKHFDTLSMGMSDDLELAIGSGSTMVRIGTAIFGKRDKQ
jgi:pyridoxal phosphate enzyme (YggS family)